MRKFLRITGQILAELVIGFCQWFISSARAIANILNAAIPYAMYFIGQKVFSENCKVSIGWELAIPIGILFIVYFLKQLGNKYGKGTTVPIPDKRFTTTDEDGEVSVAYDRTQEMLLYMADLEDYLERKGLM